MRDAGGDLELFPHFFCSRLVLDRFGRIVELQYLGKVAPEMDNLACVVGHHAGFTNAFVRKYDAGEVKDIVDFLRAEWAAAVFHDRFSALTVQLRDILSGDTAADALMEKVEAATMAAVKSGGGDLVAEKLRASGIGVCGAALPPALRRSVEHAVLAFLREHHHILPMFHVPVQQL
jgi:hypothetical protein